MKCFLSVGFPEEGFSATGMGSLAQARVCLAFSLVERFIVRKDLYLYLIICHFSRIHLDVPFLSGLLKAENSQCLASGV